MPSTKWDDSRHAARALAAWMKDHNTKFVVAESCTCGMVAALLGSVPGISDHFCGSAVTYRVATKANWLGLRPEQIELDSAESAATSRMLATHVLEKTPEASCSAAITGHLGPAAPEVDGVVYICVAHVDPRSRVESPGSANKEVRSQHKFLTTLEITCQLKTVGRTARQLEAAKLLLDQFLVAQRSGPP